MSFFGLAQYRNSVKMLPCPESRSILGWVIRQSGGAGRLWLGPSVESVGGKCPSHFEYSGKQWAGGLPSIDVTQTRAGRRSNVKPSLSEKAASHLPTGPHQHRRRRTDLILGNVIFGTPGRNAGEQVHKRISFCQRAGGVCVV